MGGYLNRIEAACAHDPIPSAEAQLGRELDFARRYARQGRGPYSDMLGALVKESQDNREGWITYYAAKGVPRELLEDADTITEMVERATEYLCKHQDALCGYCGCLLPVEWHPNCPACGAPRAE